MMLLALTAGDDRQPDVAATPEIAHDLMGLRGKPEVSEPKPRLKRPWLESTMPRTME
jgi:hypothetical protein